jgi:hypothetical protein
MALRVSRRYVPNALNRRSAQEESRGRRGPSQQGQQSAAIKLFEQRGIEVVVGIQPFKAQA